MEIIRLGKRHYKKLYKLLYKLDNECDFMMFEKGERSIKEEEVHKMLSDSGENSVFIGAFDGEKLIGYLSSFRGKYKRIKHTSYNVIGIRTEYRGKGIGEKLFNELFNWANENNIKRLELTVVCENEIAIKLYKKLGFEIEGINRKSMMKDNNYFDEYYMAKILE